MASLKDMRVRIASTKATQKITKAMQMVAASKLRRAQNAAEAARPYAEKMDAVISNIATAAAGSPGAPVRTAEQIIPLVVEATDAKAGAATSYEYEPEEDEILTGLLPRNLAVQIFRALLENNASFYGAQMSAMDNATRNAGDMIRKQTLIYNRTRQAMITKELIEIISGAEAI